VIIKRPDKGHLHQRCDRSTLKALERRIPGRCIRVKAQSARGRTPIVASTIRVADVF
jgi:hypothetical protein